MFEPLVLSYSEYEYGLVGLHDNDITRYLITPFLSSLPLKQSVIPGISRTTVLIHVFSTMPTSKSLGISDPNYDGDQL